jgi:Fur family ferric uptake transcriptional regulator
MSKNYNTKQRQAIEEAVFLSKDGHFTCEDILKKLKINGKNAGLTTIYRHLDKMVKEGKVRKHNLGAGESACYQVVDNCCRHFHLKCINCGKLVHLSCKSLDNISDHVLKQHEFFIDPAQTVFYGTCKECAK